MGITSKTSWSAAALACLLLACCLEASITKIAFKKPILGKEKFHKPKVDLTKTPKVTLSKTSLDNDLNQVISTTTSESLTTADVESSTTDITLTINSKEEKKSALDKDFVSTTAVSNDQTSSSPSDSTSTSVISSPLPSVTTESLNKLTTTHTTSEKSPSIADDSVEEPCTCGIFLSSQFVKGSQEPPQGEAVISNSLGRTFPCNGVGQKQCQTKCLEQIVQHLPNSANILCATVDRDIRKERAYLFIKNCQNKWINTNLAAGREYCCKNREPYNCK